MWDESQAANHSVGMRKAHGQGGLCKGGGLQRHIKSRNASLKCWLFYLDVKKKPKTQPKNLTFSPLPTPPQKTTKTKPFWGCSHAKEAGFSSVFTWKNIPSSKPKQHFRGQVQLWVLNKARKGLSSTSYPSNRNRKSPTQSLKVPMSELHWAALSIWSFPSGKKPFLSLSGQAFFALHTGFQKHNKILQKSTRLLLEQKMDGK